MPTMVSSNTNAPSFLIGERCADFLLREAGANLTPDVLQADAVATRPRDRRPPTSSRRWHDDQGEPISVVMIGCGKFSRYYHVPTLEADPGVTFAGIFDPLPSDDVRELADAQAPPSWRRSRRCRRRPAGRWPIVTTPHALHAEHVAFALQRELARAVRQALRHELERGRALLRRTPSGAARQCGCLQPPLRSRLPAGTRDHPRGRHWARALRRDGAARLRGQGLVPGACARRRRAIHGSRDPHGRHRALADRAPADPRARPRARRQRARVSTAAASSKCCSATSNAT